MESLIDKDLGRYHIIEQLGEGGMAIVYKAFDTRLPRNVAIKIIRKEAFPPEQLESMLMRFEREAKALASLSHPNIVKVFDYGEFEGSPYLVMEYLPGGTLKESIEKNNHHPIPWQMAAILLLPVARALAYAHQQGILHRDVKPSNIMITATGDPMLTDFGIAKILETDETHGLTRSGTGIGTPEYMAPEQGKGEKVDARADVYSLGIVFFEMVTGRKPFIADTPMAVVIKQINDPLPNPKDFVHNLPENVEHVLLKALAKQPENRYPDMNAFANALEAIASAPAETLVTKVNGEKTLIAKGKPSQSIEYPSLLPAKRKVWWTWAAGVGGLLLVAIIVAVVLSFKPPQHPANTPTSIQPLIVVSTSTPTISTKATETEKSAPTETLPITWKQGKLIYLVRNQRGRNDIYLLNLTKDNLPTLLLSPTTNQQYYGPRFAPDGRRFVYYNANGGDTLSDLQAASTVDFTYCNSPTFSPDGSKIICGDKGNQFMIFDANGKQISTLNTGVKGMLPDWSPDGEEITFSTIDGQQSTIWKIGLSGGAPMQLANEPGENYASTWSPDGKNITYQAGPPGNSDIWIMDSDGSNKRKVTNMGGGWSHGPSWSPDGNWIVFVSSQAGSVGADFGEIFIVSPKSGELVQITHTNGNVYDWRVTWGQ